METHPNFERPERLEAPGNLSGRQPLLIALITLAGAALRLARLWSLPPWHDEVFTLMLASGPMEVVRSGVSTWHPVAWIHVYSLPYYYILGRWLAWTGGALDPLFAGRLLSFAAGSITVPLLYLLGRRLVNGRAGLIAALVCALSPFHLYHSQQLRVYVVLGLFVLLMAWAFVETWAEGSGRRWLYAALFAGCAAVAVNLDQLAFVYVLAIDLWVLWAWMQRDVKAWHALIEVLAANAAAVLSLSYRFTPLLDSWLRRSWQHRGLNPSNAARVVDAVTEFHFDRSLPGWLFVPSAVAAFAVALFVIHGAWSGRHAERPSRFPAHRSLLAALSLGAMVLLFAASRTATPSMLLPAALFYYLLAGAVFAERPAPGSRSSYEHRARLAVIALCACLLPVALGFYYFRPTFPRVPVRDVDSCLREHIQSGDVVVHATNMTMLPCLYHVDWLKPHFLLETRPSCSDVPRGGVQNTLGLYPETAQEILPGASRIWFVMFRTEEETPGIREVMDTVSTGYGLTERRSFGDLDVYLYEMHAPVKPGEGGGEK